MSQPVPPLAATEDASALTEADLRSACERDLARLEAISQAATDLALELQRRTMQAMAEDDQGVPSRAIVAFNRAARVQRQTILLAHRLRRELRGQDRQPAAPAASAPPTDSEHRVEAALARLADGDHPLHEVEPLAEEAAERLERESLDPALVRAVNRSITVLRDQIEFVRRQAAPGFETSIPSSPPTTSRPPPPTHSASP